MSQPERRNKRSEITVEAVLFQLRYCENAYDLEALVMVDVNGLSFTSRLELEEAAGVLAAYAPLLFEAHDDIARKELIGALKRDLPSLGQRRVAVQRFELDDEAAYLVGLTLEGPTPPEAFTHAITGIRRIIGVTRSPA